MQGSRSQRRRRREPADRPRVVALNWRDSWHPEGGGSELYLAEVMRRLATAYDVTVFTARYPGSSADEVRDGVRYVRRGGHLAVYVWAIAWLILARVRGRLRRDDVVLEVQNGVPFLARLVVPCRVVVLVHHVHREQWPVIGPVLARIGWFLESRLAVRVDAGLPYIAVSETTRDELVALGVRAHDVTVVHNGTPGLVAPTASAPATEPTLAVLSRLVPHKQVDHALRLVARLRAEVPGLRLRVMGSGWWADELAREAERLGVSDLVDFLGHVDEETKSAELARAWVHLLPSLKEGWGLSVIEAARLGVPSVAYRAAGGVRDSILDRVTGVLVEDEDDLLEQVRRLLTDSAWRESLGHKAALRADSFTWDGTARRAGEVLGLDPETYG